MSTDKSRIQNEAAVDFVSNFNDIFFETISHHLGSFVTDSFLKDLFNKNSSKAVNKAQLLIEKFGETANPANFTLQAQSTNIQPTTLSLIFSIALYVSSRSWDNFATQFFFEFSDMGHFNSENELDFISDTENEDEPDLGEQSVLQTPNSVVDTPPVLPDVEMTPVDHTVIPENSQKKDKQKARVTVDKQVKNQSTTAKPDAKTPAKNSQKEKKLSEPEITQILTGYEAVGDEQERIRDIIVYDIPYT
ncbi:unnamed protein product [Rhizophagus irregularis]|nr:unnamed protein product [Rhizophagus irregularis]